MALYDDRDERSRLENAGCQSGATRTRVVGRIDRIAGAGATGCFDRLAWTDAFVNSHSWFVPVVVFAAIATTVCWHRAFGPRVSPVLIL